MLTEEQRETLEYLRKSPSDALKREAADLIEFLVDLPSCRKRPNDHGAATPQNVRRKTQVN